MQLGFPIERAAWQWQPGYDSVHDPNPPILLEDPPREQADIVGGAEGTITTTPAESDLLSSPLELPGIYVLFVDVSPLLAGDAIVLRLKDQVRSTSNPRTRAMVSLSGLQDPAIAALGPIEILYSVQATIQRTDGFDRSFDWRLKRIDK